MTKFFVDSYYHHFKEEIILDLKQALEEYHTLSVLFCEIF